MMKTHSSFLLLPLTVLLLAATGCSEQQLRTADAIFADANQVGQAAVQVVHGPAAPLIPGPIQDGVELGGLGVALAYGIWQRIRASRLLERKQSVTGTLSSLVKAIELLKQTDPELATALLAKIAGQIAKGSPENQVIDEIKAQLSAKIS